MKQIFKTISAVALVALAAACQKDNLGEAVPAGQEVDVNLTLTSPEIGTKAYGDGQTVNTVHVYVYQHDAQGNKYCILPGEDSPSKDLTLSNGKVTYATRLMTGQTYSFLFWADNKENTPYLLNNQTYEVTMKDDDFDVAGNNEYRDAFYATLPNVKIDGAFNADVQLKRPFAQLNFGASDYNEAKAAGFEVTAATVKVTGVGTKINLFTEEVTGTQDFMFEEAVLPTAPNDELTVGGKNYKYVAMDYILVGKNSKTLSNVTLTLKANGSSGTTPEYTYSNVPLQGNYRTNIVGNLFTNPAAVNITVAPDFSGSDDYVINEDGTAETSSVAAANAAFANGATSVTISSITPEENAAIVLPNTTKDVTISIGSVPAGKDVTIDYSSVAGAERPANVSVTAPTANNIIINLPDSHVELNGVAVNTVTASTSGNTLVVGKDVTITTLKIEKGTAEIYGKVGSVEKGENAGTVTWYVDDQANLETALNNADKVVLTADIELKSGVAVSHSTELNLNAHSIANIVDIWDATNAVVNVDNCTLSVSGKGSVKAKENDCYTFNVKNGGKLVINGGDFVGNVSVIQVDKGIAEVYGGNFSLAQTWSGAGAYGCDYMINMIDANYKTGEAKAVVYGGTFKGFNPGDCQAEGEHTNFLADGGYVVTEKDGWFTVSKGDNATLSAVLNTKGGVASVYGSFDIDYISVAKSSTLKLGANSVLNATKEEALRSNKGGVLNIKGEGTIKATAVLPAKQVSAVSVRNGGTVNIYDSVTLDGGSGSHGNYAIRLIYGTVNIYGGYFHSGADAEGGSSEVIYLECGSAPSWFCKLNINGGVFECDGDSRYLINCQDEYVKKCHISIKGGTFVGFDPADNSADGEHTNYVADGYKSVETTYNGKQAWEVVPE